MAAGILRKGIMKINKFNSAAWALPAIVLLAPVGAAAKGHKAKGPDGQTDVVGHIPFDGLSAVDMAMQKKADDKYYLYVQHPKDQGISVVDISKPARPKAIGVIPWPDPAVSSKMALAGDLAIIDESGSPAMHATGSDGDLVLWDLSNPAAPRVLQKFSGVVRWLQDERDFVYVLNGDGLWIVSKPAERQPEQTDSANSYGG